MGGTRRAGGARGATLGPLVGGVLLEYFWWGSVFLVAVPGIALLLAFGPVLLPDPKAPQPGRIDPLSVVLSFTAILPFVYGVKALARNGWEWLPAAALVCGLAAGVVFVRRQRRLEQPLLDLRLFTDRTFSSALTLTFATALVGAGALLLVNVYLQNVTGLTPLESGLVLLVPNVLMIVGNLATPPLANRIRPGLLIAGGLVVAGAGYAIFTVASSTSGPQAIFVAMCVVMVGTAPLAALCNQLGMGAVPPDKAGSGASLFQTAVEFGLGFGIATLATLGTAVYRSNVEGALGVVPPDAADAARESVDRAVAAAGRLPAAQGGDLLAAARDAFTTGLHVVGVVTAVLYAVLAVVALWASRHLRALRDDGNTTQPDHHPQQEELCPRPTPSTSSPLSTASGPTGPTATGAANGASRVPSCSTAVSP
jgi:MFS transporter, DHA2 family, multidrug resistance protein